MYVWVDVADDDVSTLIEHMFVANVCSYEYVYVNLKLEVDYSVVWCVGSNEDCVPAYLHAYLETPSQKCRQQRWTAGIIKDPRNDVADDDDNVSVVVVSFQPTKKIS